MEKSIEEIEKEIADRKEQKQELATTQQSNAMVSSAINSQVQALFEKSIEKNSDKVQKLTDNAVQTELEIKNEEVAGRKEVKKAEIRKNVTQAKAEEDDAKHERAKTILKAQGLTSKMPAPYRITALIVGYPLFFLYLLTLGWVVEFLTFTVKGFITMVADCAERFADVNKKFIENGNNKEFKLGRAMVNILKWALIIGAIIAIVLILVLKK